MSRATTPSCVLGLLGTLVPGPEKQQRGRSRHKAAARSFPFRRRVRQECDLRRPMRGGFEQGPPPLEKPCVEAKPSEPLALKITRFVAVSQFALSRHNQIPGPRCPGGDVAPPNPVISGLIECPAFGPSSVGEKRAGRNQFEISLGVGGDNLIPLIRLVQSIQPGRGLIRKESGIDGLCHGSSKHVLYIIYLFP